MNKSIFRGYGCIAILSAALFSLAGCVSMGPKQGAKAPCGGEAVTSPTLEWSTWIGGGEKDSVNAIAVDAEGNVYATGGTQSVGWIKGGLDDSQNGKDDAYVVKIRPDGTMAWSTYLGGSEDDAGSGITVDKKGNVCIVGQSKSPEWAAGTKSAHHGGNDAFVVVLSPDGSKMLWSTYVGGPGDEVGYGIATDKRGDAWVTGYTKNPRWDASASPEVSAKAPAKPLPDVFVSRLSKGKIAWTLLMGGEKDDTGRGVGVDAKGNAYVSGWTESSAWSLNDGIETGLKGARDAFVTRISPKGQIQWVKCIGGDKSESSYAIAVDRKGFPCISGRSNTNRWVERGFDTDQNGTWDAMAARLSPTGEIVWSSFVGGNRLDTSRAVTVDKKGNLYVVGLTDSNDEWFKGGPDLTYDGERDAFLTKVAADGSGIEWGTLLGGKEEEMAYAVAVDRKNEVFIGGMAKGSEWVSGGFGTTYNGGGFDGFVAKIRQ